MRKTLLTLALLLLAVMLLPLPCCAEDALPGPSRPSAAKLPTTVSKTVFREAFFANGTPITLREPTADTSGWILDREVQTALANGYSEKKTPGTGAVICWEEEDGTHYVYLSGSGKVFGGSRKADLQADVQITVTGTDVRNSFPNVSFLFGGGYEGNVTGSVTITLEESQMMYIYGGGCNGSVSGDVLIRASGSNWSMGIVGGGLASSTTKDAVADIGGNVTLDLRGTMISYMDTLVAGGLAQSISAHTAQANVGGNVTLYAEGRNVYQLCGGGQAYRTEKVFGLPTADVGGSVSVELRDSRVRFFQEGKTTLLGGVFAGGLAYYGHASVGGDVSVTVATTAFDSNAAGVVLGGMAEGEGAVADVAGSAAGNIAPDCDPANIIRGGIVHRDGSAEVHGTVNWYYTLRDGMADY